MFETRYQKILDKIAQIDPVSYGKSRNFSDGAVTRLSPYISRGVISTRMVMDEVLKQDIPFYKIEKFIQELAWRDYWQQIWIAKKDRIDNDLKRLQPAFNHSEVPLNLTEAETGIEVVDRAIQELYETGYMHNHMRMYVAAIACNNAKSHWKNPALWMHYHLLDADWASNALSWQWVGGSNSNKQYIANQSNINKYFKSDQRNTFLDTSYEAIAAMDCPEHLKQTHLPELQTILPISQDFEIDPSLPTLIYNEYNLDPTWRIDIACNRILLLEPSRFKSYPMGEKTINFIQELSKNIEGIKIFTGELKDLQKFHSPKQIIYKEHPLNSHYKGVEESRAWMSTVQGYYPSFFQFWKKCKKEITAKYALK